MIAPVSPAKNLDFKTHHQTSTTQPHLMECTQDLIHVLRKKSVDEVKDLL